MDLVDTDVLIDIQRQHPPALAWFSNLTTLLAVLGINTKHYSAIPGIVLAEPYVR